MNMLDGDAEKSMFTMANMFEADEEEKKRRSDDVGLLMLDPYFLTRGLAVFFGRSGASCGRPGSNNAKMFSHA